MTDKYRRGQRWINFMGHVLTVMGTIDKWVMLRYKRSAPFLKHENEMEVFLKKVDAEAKDKRSVATGDDSSTSPDQQITQKRNDNE